MMTSAMTQAGMMVGVIALLCYVAMRPLQSRHANRQSAGDSSGAADMDYDGSHSGHHHGGSGDSDSSGGDSSDDGDAGGGGGDGGGGD
jgi:hypothetical protein